MANPLLALITALGGAGRGFVEEERAQTEDVRKERELERREEESEFNRQEALFQRGLAAEKFVIQGLDVVKGLPLGARQSAVEAVIAGGKKMGAEFTPGLATAFAVNPELIQKSLTERSLDPQLAGQLTDKDAKWLTETIEELKQSDARRAAAGPVAEIGTPGARGAATLLERGVSPAVGGFAQIPVAPVEGRAPAGAEVRADIINEINWREAVINAQREGRPIPPAPQGKIVDTASLTMQQLIFISGADDPAVALQQTLAGARALRPGAERPATPAPSLELRRGAPAGAGTTGGALPGAAPPPDLPPANLFKNQGLRDPETGIIWRSDGKTWTKAK